jgi:uncharacterized protein DUF6916
MSDAAAPSNSFEFYAGHLRQVFSVVVGAEGSSVDMTLVEARRRPPRVVAGIRAEPFVLYFKCQSHVLLPQKTYPFKVGDQKPYGIFIVPVGRERDGVVYEAVFN